MHDVRESKADTAEHRECWDLLPWRVNGSLNAAQSERIDKHIEQCAECAGELRVQHDVRERIREHARANDSVLLAPQTGWQKMTERLDAESGAPRSRANRYIPSAPIKWAVAFAMVAVVGLGASWNWQLRQRTLPDTAYQYRTLTSAGVLVPIDSTQLRMVFHRDVAVSDVAALLNTIPAQIVAGPSEAGVYTVALQNSSSDMALPDLLKRLRADARIVFVEPMMRIDQQQ